MQLFRHAVAAVDAGVDEGSGVDGDVQLFSQMTHCFDMVGVIVGYEYGTDAVERNATFFQCFFYGADADSCINEYAICLGAQIIAVAAATAGQTYKFYFHVTVSCLNIKNAVNFSGKLTANIVKAKALSKQKPKFYVLFYLSACFFSFFRSIDSVILANSSRAMAAIRPMAAK